MGRTTDEWDALLDGTTPGPWNAGTGGIDGPGYAEVLAAETETRGFGYMAYEVPLLAGDCLDRDLPLAAAAPDAVAEVVRLRRELEELREVFVRAAEMMGKFEIPVDRQQAQGFAGRITRILEVTDV